MSNKGVVNIKGKDYKMVVARVNDFRQAHPEFGMHSDVVHHDAERVIVKVWITDDAGMVRGTGLAEEVRAASNINRTSALENAETSAFGRALASMGFGGDVSYASADEVANAINQQGGGEEYDFLVAHSNAVRENIEDVYRIKECIANDDLNGAAGYYADMDRDVQVALWRAPSKGGVWTTAERKLMSADGDLAKLIAQKKKEVA